MDAFILIFIGILLWIAVIHMIFHEKELMAWENKIILLLARKIPSLVKICHREENLK